MVTFPARNGDHISFVAVKSIYKLYNSVPRKGYSGCQVTGMIGGFFGFETSFDSVFFGGGGGGWGEWRVGRFGKHVFGWLDLSREFLGYSKVSEDSWYCSVSRSLWSAN